MNDAIKKIKKHRGATIAITALLVAFVAFSVVRCSAVHSGDEDSGSASSEQSSENSSNDNSNSSSTEKTSDESDEATIELTDEQQRVINKYGQDEENIIEALETNTWTDNNESKSIVFKDNSFTQRNTDSTKETTNTFAICAIDKTTMNPDKEGHTIIETSILTILLQDGSYTQIELHKSTSTGTNTSDFALMGDIFGTTYLKKTPAQSFDLVGMEYITNNTPPFSTEEVKKTLEEYRSIYCPTATKATWTHTMTKDYTDNTITTQFVFNNKAKSIISIEIKEETKEVVIVPENK